MSLLPPAYAVKWKIYFLATPPALSIQDRELHKEAVLSVDPVDSRVCRYVRRSWLCIHVARGGRGERDLHKQTGS